MNNYEEQLLCIEQSLYSVPSWVVNSVHAICETILRERDKGYTIFLEEFEELHSADEKKRPKLELVKSSPE